MQTLLAVALDGFYSWAAPSPDDRPWVITRQKQVLDANPLARSRGVQLGMDFKQARALVEGLEHEAWSEDAFRTHQRRWLDLLPRYSNTIEPEDQHVAFLDLSLHPDPVAIALTVVQRLQMSFIGANPPRVRWGLAESKWLARLGAAYDARTRPWRDPHGFLNPLSVRALPYLDPEHTQRLAFLGYPTVGDLSLIPDDILYAQFGKSALLMTTLARGEHYEPIRPLYPERSLGFSVRFEGGTTEGLAVQDALRTLANRAGNALTTQERQARAMTLFIETDEGVQRIEKPLQKPISTVFGCLAALRSVVFDPGPNLVTEVRLWLGDLQKVEPTQRNLDQSLDNEAKQTRFGEAINAVQRNFGETALRVASQIEIPREQRALREWEAALGL